MPDLKLNKEEEILFRKLSTPAKIQDYLNSIPSNSEPDGDTCRSPRAVIRSKSAHCIEGAMLAAAVMWYQGRKPLLLDLKANDNDLDHVVAPFVVHGRWGAVSKVNHGVLRYREPVYRDVRELVMSYFHEYFDNATGKKTLRSYSLPFDLSRFGTAWVTAENDVWEIANGLDEARHIKLLNQGMIRRLRKADPIEIEVGRVVEYPAKRYPRKKA